MARWGEGRTPGGRLLDPDLTVRVRPTGAAYGLRSAYVETFWLPFVGPTAYLLARRLTATADPRLAAHYASRDLAASLGIGLGQLARTLDRLVDLRWARWVEGTGIFEVVDSVGPLAAYQERKLPGALASQLAVFNH